ncbi:MAG: hypothetical protein G01um101420_671 [Parcubacteria group bacterium Gr01-1014_20]|nr:MAG: hypothetical protein G01um101420_671 [Parcubacteria group bacterium Gr01-1014_20]
MSQPSVQSLLSSAHDSGDLSRETLRALTVGDIGAKIQAALGTPIDNITATEVILVSLLIDDSGSIRFVPGNTEAVRDGHNLIIESLKKSKQSGDVLVHCRYLNGTVLYPYQPIDQVAPMDSHNFNPDGSTPLYDESAVLLGTVLAKAREYSDNGIAVRTITLIVTDGHDQHSVRQTTKTVSAIVADLLRAETHIVAGMGVDDGHTDFRQIFREMGILDQWILTPGNSPTEIRKGFQVFSQSAARASQNAGTFSQTAIGGFAG